LRSSLHFSHTESFLLLSNSVSMRPLNWPPVSLIRTSDFSVLPSSSIVFHTPTGEVWAQPAAAGPDPVADALTQIHQLCDTLKGNVNWMYARQSILASPMFGDDIRKLFPIVAPGGSDSASFDNVLELLYLAGNSFLMTSPNISHLSPLKRII